MDQAPYAPDGGEYSFQDDRALFLDGLAWLDGESVERFRKPSPICQRAALGDLRRHLQSRKGETRISPAGEILRAFSGTHGWRILHDTEGTKDLKYVGNVAMATFDVHA